MVFKLQDVTSYHVDERLGGSASFNVMNKSSFAGLPAKARKAIEDNAGYRDSRDLDRVLDENSDIAARRSCDRRLGRAHPERREDPGDVPRGAGEVGND
jgi:hypothetical protein